MSNLYKRQAFLTKRTIGTPPSYEGSYKGIAYCKKEFVPIEIDDIEYIEISGGKLYKEDIVKYDTLELAWKPEEYPVPKEDPLPKNAPRIFEVRIK